MHLMRSYLNAFSNNTNIFPCRCSILMEIVRFVYRTYRLQGTFSIVTISWTRDRKFPVVGTCTTTQLLGTMRCRLRQSTSDSSCKRRGRRNYTSRCTCSFLEPLIHTGELYMRMDGAPVTLTWNKEKRNHTLEKYQRKRSYGVSLNYPFSIFISIKK